MWRYKRSSLSSNFLQSVRRNLIVTGSDGNPMCAYGDAGGVVLLPRFFGCPAMPMPDPYARWVARPTALGASTTFRGSLMSQPPQTAAARAAMLVLDTEHGSAPSTPGSLVRGCLLSLKPGFGRIATCLWAASRLRFRTVIVAHNNERAGQWAAGVGEFFANAPGLWDDFSVTTSGQCHSEEATARLQTAGLVILDDANCLGQDFYIMCLNLWNIPKILGVTSAGKDSVIPLATWSAGPVVYQSEAVWAPAGPPSAPPTAPPAAPPAAPPGNAVSNLYHIAKAGLSPLRLQSIREELFMQPKTYNIGPPGEEDGDSSGFPAYSESDHFISVPRFYGIARFGVPADITGLPRGEPMAPAVQFAGELKTDSPPQQAGHDVALSAMGSAPTSGTILNFYCGAGKTVLAVAISVSWGRRTLILVHTEDLLDQWIRRLERFAPGASVGRLQQNTCQIEGRDFVVGMLQSIASRDYPEEHMRTFGLCVVDECHRVACRFFSSALSKIQAPHILGLSATAYRKDGMDNLLHWTCGPIRMSAVRPHVEVTVRMAHFKSAIRERRIRGKFNRSRMLNDLAEEETRNEFILAELTKGYLGGRTIILLSERISLIKWIRQKLEESPLLYRGDFGEHTGVVKAKERTAALSKRIILATYQKAKEGLDVPELDMLILATPVSDVVQSTGRILRQFPDKKTPLILDIWDRMDPFLGSGHARRRYYKKEKYTIAVEEAMDQ